MGFIIVGGALQVRTRTPLGRDQVPFSVLSNLPEEFLLSSSVQTASDTL